MKLKGVFTVHQNDSWEIAIQDAIPQNILASIRNHGRSPAVELEPTPRRLYVSFPHYWSLTMLHKVSELVFTCTDETSVRKGTSRDPLPEPIEVKAPEEEKQQLLRLLYRMKNGNGKELRAKELLEDPLFNDPENRYHTIV